jgi:hypothetical protein
MFRDSSNGIEEFTISVTGLIIKCINNVIPTVTVRTYPYQIPWITGNIRNEIKSVGQWSGTLIRTHIRNPAKGKASIQDKSYFIGSDPHWMWQGLKLSWITKGSPVAGLPEELNAFYVRFEACNTEPCMRTPAVLDDCVITLL